MAVGLRYKQNSQRRSYSSDAHAARCYHLDEHWVPVGGGALYCPGLVNTLASVQVTITQRAALLRYHAAELRLLDGEGAWQLRAIEHGAYGNGPSGAGGDASAGGGNGAVQELPAE